MTLEPDDIVWAFDGNDGRAEGLRSMIELYVALLVTLPPTEEPAPRAISRLNRGSLQRIAERAGGQYFELDREPDREIANAIVDAGRRLAPPREAAPAPIEYYPQLLTAAVALAALALLFARTRTEAWLQAGLVAAALLAVVRFLG